MTRPPRHFLPLALVAMHLLVTLAGTYGHELAGVRHRSAARPSARVGAGDHQSHLQFDSVVADAGDHCLIGQFQHQAQATTEPLSLHRGALVQPLNVAKARPTPVRFLPDRSRPRAPPALFFPTGVILRAA